MDEELKKDLGKLARHTELKVARSVLRWKYRREGRAVPLADQLDHESRRVADRARQVLSRRGKTVLEELKKAYRKGHGQAGQKGPQE